MHGYTSPVPLVKYVPSPQLVLFHILLLGIEANLGRFTYHFTIHRALRTRSIHSTNLVNKSCRPTREGVAAAEAVAIVVEVVVTVAEDVVIAADAAVTTTGAEEQDVAVSSLGAITHQARTEVRCLSVVVHRAPVPAVVAAVAGSGEVDRPVSNVAYICKSNNQGSKRVSCEYILTPS